MHRYTLGLKGRSQGRGGTVVTAHLKSLEFAETGDGAHTYAANAYEIYFAVSHFFTSL